MKNETIKKVTEAIARGYVLDAAGCRDRAADELEKVLDIILFEISDCVNPVPEISSDLTVGVLRFVADTLEKNLNDKEKETAEFTRDILRTKYKALVIRAKAEERR